MENLRKRIENREKLCGTLVSLSDPCICEIFGYVGYDFVWIDTEHPYFSLKDLLCHLNAARAAGTHAIVRVPQDDLTATKKILEMEPDGIIFPMVHSAQEARRLIQTTLYPPAGTRGFGPMRAIGYGTEDAQQYVDSGSKKLCRFVQIEHIDCVKELEEIVKIEEIDGFIFGPNDLSGSIGQLGHVFDPDTTALIEEAIKILRAHGKYVGLCGGFDPDTIAHWSSFGIDMLTVGGDWNFLCAQAQKTLNDLRSIYLEQGKKE